jgi:aspartate kinase
MNKELVVLKFGGTSVGTPARIVAVAERVKDHIERQGQQVIVVVSAMSGETDRLIDLAKKVGNSKTSHREYHQLLASGEQVSSALTALAIEAVGLKAKSLLAFQVGIQTRSTFGHNLIENVDTSKPRSLLEQGIIPVVAGFQGVDSYGDFTTLGRGGSDTTAVALAAAFSSCKCYIYTDVEGVYSAPPAVCKNAKKLERLTYEEMLELASSGAKVLQSRSVNLAYKHKVPLIVCSSFVEAEGTQIVEEYPGMENIIVSSISHRVDESKITIRDIPDVPGMAAKIFKTLSEANIVVDMIVQSEGQSGRAVISCTVPQEQGLTAADVLRELLVKEIKGSWIEVDNDVAKISVVGEGMRMHAGVAAQVFDILAREKINVQMISTSEIKISIIVKSEHAEHAVCVLHQHFLESA